MLYILLSASHLCLVGWAFTPGVRKFVPFIFVRLFVLRTIAPMTIIAQVFSWLSIPAGSEEICPLHFVCLFVHCVLNLADFHNQHVRSFCGESGIVTINEWPIATGLICLVSIASYSAASSTSDVLFWSRNGLANSSVWLCMPTPVPKDDFSS